MEGTDGKKMKFVLCESAAQVAACNGIFALSATMRDTRISARENSALIYKSTSIFNLLLYHNISHRTPIASHKNKANRFVTATGCRNRMRQPVFIPYRRGACGER